MSEDLRKEISLRTYRNERNFDKSRFDAYNKMVWVLGNFYLLFTEEDGFTYLQSMISRLENVLCKIYFENLERELFKVISELSGENSLPEIREKITIWKDNGGDVGAEDCFKVLVLVYVKMRQKGYSRASLII